MTNHQRSCTTVRAARTEIGRALSQGNQKEQIRILNLIRAYLYANQRQLGLDLSTTFCIKVECFCEECPVCPDKPLYRGFRLPTRFRALNKVEINSQHAPVFSHWRIPYDGPAGFPDSTKAKLYDNGFSPLERDFSSCHPTALRISQEKCTGNTQTMTVTGRTLEDRVETFDYMLTNAAVLTNEVFKEVTQVSFPSGVDGTVIIAEPDGRELARYHCGQTVPKFREYKLKDGCCPDNVIVTATSSYEDVYDDLDLVEHGNPLVWQTLARFIRLVNKDEKDSNDRANMKEYLALAVSLMVEQSAVEEGNVTQSRFRRASLKSGRLSSEHYGARRR